MNTYSEYTEQFGIKDFFRAIKPVYTESITLTPSNNKEYSMDLYLHNGVNYKDFKVTLPVLKQGNTFSLNTNLSGNALRTPQNIDSINQLADALSFDNKDNQEAMNMLFVYLETYIDNNLKVLSKYLV